MAKNLLRQDLPAFGFSSSPIIYLWNVIVSTLYIQGAPIKQPPWCLIITLANVVRFSKFSYRLIRIRKISMHVRQIFPLHLQLVATLPCEIRKFENVTDFGSIHRKLLTCLWDTYSTRFNIYQTADIDELTFRCLSDDVSNQQLNVVASRWFFFIMVALSSHCFCSKLYFICCTMYTYLSKIISMIFYGRLNKISR